MTGKHNWRNYRSLLHMGKGQTTLAHLMRRAGYVTGLSGKWQLWGGPDSSEHRSGITPDEAGFDEHMFWAYRFELSKAQMQRYDEADPPGDGGTSRYWHPAILKNGEYVRTSTDDYGPDLFSEFVLDFIERHRRDRFFLFYPMGLTHSPFVATPRSRTITPKTKLESDPRFFADMVS